MSVIRWKLADFLAEHGLTAYALGKAMGTSYMNTVYRMARRGHEPSRIDLPTLVNVLDGLRTLTGKDVEIADILVYEPSVIPER
ncbi:hypothetical protein CBQ26_14380 [Deinococcus indicus]|jgi:hypothetical protein|uniref:HTH cro/C1-type domain-containing protein n=1 Tax=Deinococcus indicus TaxID=223556 RepID=A0A246BHG4_9DEIO|nr:hypothetical protein CBQ26_14380 [Deinococcus indicus]GHG41737.1 hypothetical protein GCM10017784_40730 [Deinococcus indicus]